MTNLSRRSSDERELSFRSFSMRESGSLDEENRTIRFPVVSDSPVEIYRGCFEILSHAPGALRLGQRQQTMALLYNHDWDRLLGVVENIEQDEHRTYVTVRFAKTEEGDKALALVKDRVLVNVSCGYRVHDCQVDEGQGIRTATDWEIFEVSLVTVPADPSVGVYRMKNKGNTMPDDQKNAAQQEPKIDVRQVQQEERDRIAAISAMCRDFNISGELQERMIAEGVTIDQARQFVMDDMKKKRQVAPAADSNRSVQKDFNLGLTEKEQRRYSLVRALNASMSGNWQNAGFEREVSQELSRRMGRESTGFFMPTNLPFVQGSRDYLAGEAAKGGNLIATNLLAGSFIEALRAKAVVLKLGATMMSGLVGKVEIPKQSGVSTTSWIAENGKVEASNATFNKVALDMKTIAARSFISRNLLLQSSIDVENFVRMELIKSIALGIDLAAISGSGTSGQPKGIANQTGIKVIACGTNGGQISFDHLIDMETEVAKSNADVLNMAYLANAATIGALKKLKDGNNNYIWKTIADGFKNSIPGEVNGYPVARSNQVRGNLTKGTSSGVCNELFFGDWSSLIIGEWGVLELLPNPYSATAYESGGVEIRALQSLDIAVRHPESFAYIGDALLTASAGAGA